VNTDRTAPCHFDFCFPRMDTLLRVEVEGRDITIRATRDTFTERQKDYFVRELAAEGFIPEESRWFRHEGPEPWQHGVRWLVDFAWLEIDEAVTARTRRWMHSIIALAFLSSVLLVGLAATGRLGNTVHQPPSRPWSPGRRHFEGRAMSLPSKPAAMTLSPARASEPA
jgi:hypothetical protein